MRKTRLIAGVAGIAALGLALTGCSGGGGGGDDASGGEGEYTLILGHEGSSTDPRQQAAEELAALIEEKTDGSVTVEVHGDSTLGTFAEMIDGLQLGSADIVIESPLALEAYTDLAAIDTAPFLYENEEQFFSVWDGEIGDEIKQTLTDESGYAILGNMFRGARQLTTKEPVTSLDDLQGMTIRTPSAQTMLDTWNTLGARAEAMPFNEVYSALESGVLDGQENPLDAIYTNSIHEVAPEITETSHMYANYHFLMWNDTLQGYPEDIRVAIEEAADEVGESYTARTLENIEQYTADLEAEGATFHQLEDRDAWVDAVQPVVESLPDQVQTWIEEIKAQ